MRDGTESEGKYRRGRSRRTRVRLLCLAIGLIVAIPLWLRQAASSPAQDPRHAALRYPAFIQGLGDSNGSAIALIVRFTPTGRIIYSTYLGGNGHSGMLGQDWGTGIAVDATGNAYVVGKTYSEDFPLLQAMMPSNPDDAAAFVAKLDPRGRLLYSTFLTASSHRDSGHDTTGGGIALGRDGSIYVAGVTRRHDLPLHHPIQRNFRGRNAWFVARLDPSGHRFLFNTYLGGNNIDTVAGLALDAVGNAYVAGNSEGGFPLRHPVRASEPDFSCGSYSNWPCGSGVLAEFSPSGHLVFATYLGGTSSLTHLVGIAVNRKGEIAATGDTQDGLPATNALQRHFAGGRSDAWIAMLAHGTHKLRYMTYLGGSETDEAHSAAMDSSGDVFVAGGTDSKNFPDNGKPYAPPRYDKTIESPGTLPFITRLGNVAS